MKLSWIVAWTAGQLELTVLILPHAINTVENWNIKKCKTDCLIPLLCKIIW